MSLWCDAASWQIISIIAISGSNLLASFANHIILLAGYMKTCGNRGLNEFSGFRGQCGAQFARNPYIPFHPYNLCNLCNLWSRFRHLPQNIL